MRMRWLVALLFAGGLAAGLGVDVTATAHASGRTPAEQPWNEISLPLSAGQGGTMCVGGPGRASAAGAPLRLTRCHGYASDGAPQRWHFPATRLCAPGGVRARSGT